MKPTTERRVLRVRREALAELSADELAVIEGAQPVVKTLPLNNCIGTKFNCWNSEPCPGTSMC